MQPVTRVAILCVFCAFMAVFWLLPDWLALTESDLILRAATVQLGGPLIAALACWFAGQRSSGTDRKAWRHFAIGSLLYFVGNFGYVMFGLQGYTPTFPSLPELAFFLMAGFFTAGMLQYSQIRSRIGPIHIYNFALIYAAVALSSLFTLNHDITGSVIGPFGTAVAFFYPALWFSVAAFGAISLALYVHGRKGFGFGLMVLAVLAEALADYRYALGLMEGRYEFSGVTQLLWVISSALIIWSAAEHIVAMRRPADNRPHLTRRSDRIIAQAALPAIAVGAILVTAAISGVLGNGLYAAIGCVIAIAFALIAGFREHWIIETQRRLRYDVEASREKLAASQRRLMGVLESTNDSVLVVDKNWGVVYFNQHAAELIGQGDRLKNGVTLWDLFPEALATDAGAHYRRVVEAGQPAEFEIFVGDLQAWLGVKAYPTDEGLSIFFRDITEQRAARDEIEHLAHHDPLTGLANRTLFQRKLREAADSSADAAILLIDLDHFKEVNDTLGHAVGDALLVGTARRLRDILGTAVTIGRLGGDEFAAILVGGDGRSETTMLALKLIDSVSAPHMIGDQSVRVGASIGIALSSGRSTGPNELLRDADIALYAAKTEARGAVRFFEPSMQVELLHKQALRTDLAGALDRGEFALAFQPQLDLRSGRVSGFEALLRWHHPHRGLVSPDEFIPVAEESGQIVAIGNWALRQACLEALKWPADISVAVNLSPRQFATDDLAEMVHQAIAETGFDAARLELEITETVMMRDSTTNLLILRRLRSLGIRIALDDFGTGFSSLGYLQSFPFSKIKIDRTFISGLPGSEESQAIVRSVMGLGKSLGKRVTAEGVETQAQLDWVRNGCDEAQGYFISRPVPASHIPALIEQLNAPENSRLAG
ncbi:MAG: GGDEF and EAL domain-containing protein [Hyphomicrobiales bacterium]|nr:MAG: GGDEF and EAL domain-containing protein [Hyphomicrobiales bacterium]